MDNSFASNNSKIKKIKKNGNQLHNDSADLNEKTEHFTNEISLALDECAPFKCFKIRENYRPGLSQTAKDIMKERDTTRKSIARAPDSEKPTLKQNTDN